MSGPRLAQALLFARVMVATVLLLAGVAKLSEKRDRLEIAIRAYGISSSRIVASVLPLLELGLGAALLLGLLMPLPALGSVFLFVAFVVVMSVNLAQGRIVPCACFGVDDKRLISWSKVALDLLLAAVAWVASGWLSGVSWHWPIALEPDGMSLVGSDIAADVLDAIGLLAVIALTRALVSLPRVRADEKIREMEPSGGKTLTSPPSGKPVELHMIRRDG